MEEVAKPYFHGRPNSYILTKALAESYVKKHCLIFDDENNNFKENNQSNSNELTIDDVQKNNRINNLVSQRQSQKHFKTYVVRPSIVYNSKSEPAEGWVDSYNGNLIN